MNYRAGGRGSRPKGRDEWRTPLDLFATLNDEFRFELDAACRQANRLAPRGLCRDLGDDAMLMSWEPGPVWCNPPYSHIRPWLERALLAAQSTTVVMLIPADTSTRWWIDFVSARATEVRFVVGRLHFRRPDGSKHVTKRGGGGHTTPSAIVIYGCRGGPPAYSYINRKGQLLLQEAAT